MYKDNKSSGWLHEVNITRADRKAYKISHIDVTFGTQTSAGDIW